MNVHLKTKHAKHLHLKNISSINQFKMEEYWRYQTVLWNTTPSDPYLVSEETYLRSTSS